MKVRAPGGLLAFALVSACGAPTPPTGMPPSATPDAAAGPSATLTVSGSGFVCGPWYYGCGAILTVASPGSKAPVDWTPGAGDTWFKVAYETSSDGPYPVTGVGTPGQDRLDPGSYRLVVVMTEQSDVGGATMSPSFGCSADIVVVPGTVAVHVDVRLRVSASPCSIAVSMEGPSPGPDSTG